MGNYTVSKGILLDERDFKGASYVSLEELAEKIHDPLREEFESERGWPDLEILGIASERFGATHIFGFKNAGPQWIDPKGDFNSFLVAEYKRLGLPDPEAILSANPATVELLLQQKICEQVRVGAYGYAEKLISALSDIFSVGLPGIREACHFCEIGDEDLFDFRDANHQPGTRLLAEISFTWGQ